MTESHRLSPIAQKRIGEMASNGITLGIYRDPVIRGGTTKWICRMGVVEGYAAVAFGDTKTEAVNNLWKKWIVDKASWKKIFGRKWK